MTCALWTPARTLCGVRRKLKQAVELPVRTTSSFLHLPRHLGGPGPVLGRGQAGVITRALKCLSSRNRTVSDLAWDQLSATVKKRTGAAPEHVDDILHFLNTPAVRGEAVRGDVRSTWSMVHKSLSVLGCSIEHQDRQYQTHTLPRRASGRQSAPS